MNTQKDILVFFRRLYKQLEEDEARLRVEVRKKKEKEQIEKLIIKLNKKINTIEKINNLI